MTVNVELLYNCVPHKKGITQTKRFLRETDRSKWPVGDFAISLLVYILGRNVFLFHGHHYLQVQGVAMGTCCTPSYANLYLGVEETLTSYTSKIAIWLRYIEDIFLILEESPEALHDFIRSLHINEYNFKFTFQYDTQEVSFLDVRLFREDDGSLGSSLFCKETAGNSVHYQSFHPTLLKNCISFSQYLRVWRNCSTESRFLA